MLTLNPSRLAQVFPTPHLAQVCFGASVPNAIIKPKRKLCGITCVSSVLPVCNRIQKT